VATIDGIGRARWVPVAGKTVRRLAAGGRRIRTIGSARTRERKKTRRPEIGELSPAPSSYDLVPMIEFA
jgi:hypothetical protein